MKKRILSPRRKRMRRPARLATAARWLASYGGKHVVHGYARWYGVDRLCAIKELRLLGVAVSQEYESQIRGTLERRAEARRLRRNAAETTAADTVVDDAFLLEFADDPDDDWFTPEFTPSPRRPGTP
ncbi:MAG: hypothetical protein IPH44_19990 [Myxococcales bacterium]|nr:hypothetical protein [Myxococcales bacterium]MBK7195129.1 hypothetical protein [Myxococcales bacterium]